MIHRSTSSTNKHYVLARHEKIMGVPGLPSSPMIFRRGCHAPPAPPKVYATADKCQVPTIKSPIAKSWNLNKDYNSLTY